MSINLEFEVLDDESVEDALDNLNGWETDQRAIHKTYQFNSFMEAIAFVNRVAVVAETLGHHPDIHINYKEVTLRCWTHKNNAITKADITLAHEIEKTA